LVIVWKLLCGEGCQGVAAAARMHHYASTLDLNVHVHAIGESPNQVKPFPRWNRGFAGLLHLHHRGGTHFNLEIRSRKRQATFLDGHEQVSENRQRLPAFDHADDLLHWFEQDFPLSAEAHVGPRGGYLLTRLLVNKLVEAGDVDNCYSEIKH